MACILGYDLEFTPQIVAYGGFLSSPTPSPAFRRRGMLPSTLLANQVSSVLLAVGERIVNE